MKKFEINLYVNLQAIKLLVMLIKIKISFTSLTSILKLFGIILGCNLWNQQALFLIKYYY